MFGWENMFKCSFLWSDMGAKKIECDKLSFCFNLVDVATKLFWWSIDLGLLWWHVGNHYPCMESMLMWVFDFRNQRETSSFVWCVSLKINGLCYTEMWFFILIFAYIKNKNSSQIIADIYCHFVCFALVEYAFKAAMHLPSHPSTTHFHFLAA